MSEERKPHEPEEQVEDLDVSKEDAEDVQGGFSWGVTQTYKVDTSITSINLSSSNNL